MATQFLGHQLPQSVHEKLRPATSALIVIDVQNDFIHDDGYFGGSAALQAIVGPIANLTDAARAAGVPVHFAQIVQEPDGSAASPVWISEALRRGYEPYQCMSGTWGAQNVDKLTPQPGDAVHVKRRRSAFRGTALDAELRAAGITTLVLTGLAADGCVEFTARDGLDLDYHPVVALDAIANAGQDSDKDWRDHYAKFLPGENLLTASEICAIWER